MNAFLAYLATAGAFLKAVPWYFVALPLVFLAGCCGGCSCERARPHILTPDPEPQQHVLTINGKNFTYDKIGPNWSMRK